MATILSMAKFDDTGHCIGLCRLKSIKRIVAIYEKRGFVSIEKDEYNRLLQQRRALGETEMK